VACNASARGNATLTNVSGAPGLRHTGISSERAYGARRERHVPDEAAFHVRDVQFADAIQGDADDSTEHGVAANAIGIAPGRVKI
jgi:hypothetical protein